MALVYLNGEYKPLAEATVNVLDRGFIFGDAVYEVIPVFNRKIFRLEAHLQRLENSLAAINLYNPLTKSDWYAILQKLIETVSQEDQSLYIQITRGVSERDYDMSLADAPTVFAMTRPLLKKDFSAGIHAITHEDIRWQYCHIKATSLLAGVLLRQRAKEQGASEAILIRANQVTEGAASNVFICKNNQIITPIANQQILTGVTRDVLLTILRQNGLDCVEKIITKEALLTADEVWLTSSMREIAPVVQLDQQAVATGKPGPLWVKANQLYQAFKRDYGDDGNL